MTKPFTFLLTPVEFGFAVPTEVVPGYRFTRASETQIKTIEEEMRRRGHGEKRNFYVRWTEVIQELGIPLPLPQNRWFYNVLEFDDETNLPQLKTIFKITVPEVRFGWSFFGPSGDAISVVGSSVFALEHNYWNDLIRESPSKPLPVILTTKLLTCDLTVWRG